MGHSRPIPVKLQEYHAKTLLARGRSAGAAVVGGVKPGRGTHPGARLPRRRRRPRRDQGAGPGRRSRQGRWREAGGERGRGRGGRGPDPGHADQGHHGAAGAGRAGRGHRAGAVPRGGARPRGQARPLHGLGRGRGRDRAAGVSDPGAIRTLHAHPHLGLLDYQARLLAFDLGLGDHLKAAVGVAKGLFKVMVDNDADLVEINPLAIVRERARGRDRQRIAPVPRRQDHDRRLGAAPPSRARGDAGRRRGGPGRRRGAPPGPELHPARRQHRLHGQRRRPGDGHHGPREARRRRARQLPGHRRRARADKVAAALRLIVSDPACGRCWSTSSAASRAATRWHTA